MYVIGMNFDRGLCKDQESAGHDAYIFVRFFEVILFAGLCAIRMDRF